jgi:hypothetical protein
MKTLSPRIPRTSRLVVAAWMLLACQGAGLLHHLVVQQHLCAEHGEWTDAESNSQGEVGKPDHSPALGLNAGFVQLSGEHEHCALMIVERSSANHCNAVSIPPPRVEHAASPLLPSDPIDVARVPVLRLAPKGSPPANV